MQRESHARKATAGPRHVTQSAVRTTSSGDDVRAATSDVLPVQARRPPIAAIAATTSKRWRGPQLAPQPAPHPAMGGNVTSGTDPKREARRSGASDGPRSILVFERANHVRNLLNVYPRLGLRRYPRGGTCVALKGLNTLQYAIRHSASTTHRSRSLSIT